MLGKINEIHKWIFDQVEQVKGASVLTSETYESKLADLTKRAFELGRNHGGHSEYQDLVDDITNQDKRNKTSVRNNQFANNVSHSFQECTTYYKNIHENYLSLREPEKLSLRVNSKLQRSAVFYRVATTLGIGFAIMLVYWVASRNGISMPLIRISG